MFRFRSVRVGPNVLIPWSTKSSRPPQLSFLLSSELAWKFSAETRKQSVNHIHWTRRWLRADCAADFSTLPEVPAFLICVNSPRAMCVSRRIRRCGRAPPTACTSRRATRSTAPSAAATFTRRVTGERFQINSNDFQSVSAEDFFFSVDI